MAATEISLRHTTTPHFGLGDYLYDIFEVDIVYSISSYVLDSEKVLDTSNLSSRKAKSPQHISLNDIFQVIEICTSLDFMMIISSITLLVGCVCKLII